MEDLGCSLIEERVKDEEEGNGCNSGEVSLLSKDYKRSSSNRRDELRHFRTSLCCWGLDQSTRLRRAFSLILFILFTICVPVFSSFFVECPKCDEQGYAFDKLVQIPQCILASISFIALSRYLRKYGLRKFLFLDQLCDDTAQVQLGYTTELDKAFKLLAWILLPSFLIEIVHKILWYSTVTVSIPFISGRILSTSLVFTAVITSWLYRTGVFLLVCMLFRLTCHLQILRFDGFRKFLEEYSSDVSIILKEHMRIRHQLFLTSHRFRFFVLASLLTITISQFAALLMTLSSRTEINFFNAGDLVVCSVVQVTGFLLCLLGAARITHRAQGTVSVATRWHVLATCTSYGSSYPQTENLPSPQSHVESSVNPFSCVDSASDSETSEVFFMFPSKDASAAFEIRQAFVTYLQHNNGGITLFGFVLDRGLLHTLFAFEFSLVMWILSKAIRFS
ncbi:hypothetical protein SUGI_0508980 [Cryptomeria japonica]|uniref:uncharacterized protein LOC131076468 n=1 Tax=Cryptomeria japonica TaxID=3369 RepID=UPI002408AF8E|nr:uncharacterized protein LOC131076468 [Cryptomeria japonica]GLJ26402.1 hypothetical protein SUGI_0508980 [Cryptomeria japonica]